MNPRPPIIRCLLALVCLAAGFGNLGSVALAQQFNYEAKPRAAVTGLSYSSPEPAPRMMLPSEAGDAEPVGRGYLYSRYTGRRDERADERGVFRRLGFTSSSRADRGAMRAGYNESIPPGTRVDPFGEDLPVGGPVQPLPGTQSRQDGAQFGWDQGSDGQMVNSPGGPYSDEGYYGDEGYYDDGQGPWCDECCDDNCHHCFCTCVRAWLRQSCLFRCDTWKNASSFGGAQGFKGPADMGVNGNFGFHKGLNYANPLVDRWGIGYQLGGTIALSDFEGGSGIVNDHRDQFFITTGLFRRAPCNRGLQGGAVLDYLHDQFYVTMNLMQIRAELSYVMNLHELGFWCAAHTKSDTQVAPVGFPNNTVTWQANDQYNLFYRRRFSNGGIWRMWLGLSSHGDGIFGADGTAPLSEHWGLQVSYNYLLPRSDPTIPDAMKESWNLSIGWVWYPACKVPNACFAPYRPLFNVADNGTLMITTKQ